MLRNEIMARYQALSAELQTQHAIAMDVDRDSDDVIHARKEIARIQFDIAWLLEKLEE